MSNIISDFFINPVLQQARRFSRSNTPSEPVESLRNGIDTRTLGSNDGNAVEDMHLRRDSAYYASNNLRDDMHRSDLSGDRLSSPPLGEDESQTPLPRPHTESTLSSSGLTDYDMLPIRSLATRSINHQMSDDISDNASLRILDNLLGESSGGTSDGQQNAHNSGSVASPFAETVQDSARNIDSPYPRSGPLPEDDGMGHLRKQILQIQDMDVGTEAKARMMHELLSQGYNQIHAADTKAQLKRRSQASMISQERPTTPSSLSSLNFWQQSSDATPPTSQHIFHLSPEDLRRTYAPIIAAEMEESGESEAERATEIAALGCKHYRRNVKLQCSTCDRWYTCRLCHDEVEDHVLIRKETKNMLCMICGSAQRAGEYCVKCGERAAWYYCGICKLWDDDPNKNIYHCNDCGICRKGLGLGKDFFHCKTCGVCMSMSVEKSHKCIERVSDCDCPICGEYMFTSLQPVVFMICGHSIHQACYYEHMKTSYKCPICSKSTLNMETQFRNLDRAIEAQPMPPQFQDTKATISCNDCHAKSVVKYHWLGLKCAICDSYNTAQLSILSDSGEVTQGDSLEPGRPANVDVTLAEGSMPAAPRDDPGRPRRYSSQVLPVSIPSTVENRFPTYSATLRLGRSVSPTLFHGFFGGSMAIETDESGDEDEPDFWGRDTSRSPTFVNDMEESEDEGEDDEDNESAVDDCEEEDGDEEDQFELIGHR